MNFIVQVALAFFVVQFLVVLAIMVVALFVAQPEVPVFSAEAQREAFSQGLAFAGGLPRRAVRASRRLARFVHGKLSLPVYHF